MKVGLVGARGYVGAELIIELLAGHPRLELGFAASRQGVGEAVAGAPGLTMDALTPETVAGWQADAVVLALPNALAGAYVSTLSARTVIVDLSADHRFDPAWVYGLPERGRAAIAGARRVANPGCYATGMQLGLAPLLGLLAGPPQVFGVSGYSGAGHHAVAAQRPRAAARQSHALCADRPSARARGLASARAARALHRRTWRASFRGISLTIAATLDAPGDAGEPARALS
jgi:N-acetyl-gamma-glutamylphosphate reductase